MIEFFIQIAIVLGLVASWAIFGRQLIAGEVDWNAAFFVFLRNNPAIPRTKEDTSNELISAEEETAASVECTVIGASEGSSGTLEWVGCVFEGAG